jgi:hypothetical protein
MQPNVLALSRVTAVQDYVHYTYFSIEEHTNEDTQPKSRRLLRRVGRHFIYYSFFIILKITTNNNIHDIEVIIDRNIYQPI